MGMLTRFDLSSDYTRFFLTGLVLLMIFSVLLTIVSPKRRKKRRGAGKVDDRAVSWEGELID